MQLKGPLMIALVDTSSGSNKNYSRVIIWGEARKKKWKVWTANNYDDS